MSSMFERLQKAAEEKRKASEISEAKEKPKLEVVSPASGEVEVGVSKSKQAEVKVSKPVQVKVSKSKQEEVSVSKGKQVKRLDTSPKSDFTKTPNSAVRRAIPEKYFRGLSKHTYDVLWLLTRGAVVPKRTVQLTKEDLVRRTGLSKDAVKLHIKYLKESGLVTSYPAIGSRSGWEYEVFTIEEIEDGVSMGKTDEASVSKRNENLPLHTVQNLLPLTPSQISEQAELNPSGKTIFKTNTNDDEAAFTGFIEKINCFSEETTGKKPSSAEKEKWSRLADLLILELRAASRHTQISSIPAFLTEHLRRRLMNSPATGQIALPKKDSIGKADESGDYKIKPLDRKSREAALELLREFAEADFLSDFEKWYTAEDWQWLIENLKS